MGRRLFTPLCVTTARQPTGAPVIDGAMQIRTHENGRNGRQVYYDGVAIHLTPWRRNEFGDRVAGRALIVGVIRRRGGQGAPRWVHRPERRPRWFGR